MKTEKDLKNLEEWLGENSVIPGENQHSAMKISITDTLFIESKLPGNIDQALRAIPLLIAEIRRARKPAKKKKAEKAKS